MNLFLANVHASTHIGVVSDLIGGLSTCVSILSTLVISSLNLPHSNTLSTIQYSLIGIGSILVSSCQGVLLQALLFGIKFH
jgi:hypothetical protein